MPRPTPLAHIQQAIAWLHDASLQPALAPTLVPKALAILEQNLPHLPPSTPALPALMASLDQVLTHMGQAHQQLATQLHGTRQRAQALQAYQKPIK